MAGLVLARVSKKRNPLIDIMNAVTILKGNPDKIKDICKKLFAPEPDKNGMLYIQIKNNLNPNQTISDSTVGLYTLLEIP